jgi:anthranilate synthase component 1
MRAEPAFDAFTDGYKAGRPQLVWTKRVADLETPISAMLKLADGKPHTFLLESVEGGATRGRYSMIGLKPDVIWRCRGDKAEINRSARSDPNAFKPEEKPSLDSLRALIGESRIEVPLGLPPMASGVFGYMGYDMVRLVEDLPALKPDKLGLPDSIFLRPTVIAIFDNVEDIIIVVTPVWPRIGLSAHAAYDQAVERLGDAVNDLDRSLPHQRSDLDPLLTLPEPSSNMSPDDYKAMVLKAKEYILAGDIFQVVLSQRFSLPFSLPPFALYRSLRRLNPSPFLFFLDLGGFAVIGSSPEILVRLRDETVTIRPIAGTRPRGKTPDEDRRLAADLLSDQKELAEHLMLLDLGRNDVGRVARIGSVKVTERNIIEYYSHVMHIVSNVDGKIDPQHDAMSALMAGFPAGTVSGAPKVRAMEIIEELEPERRGIYGGAVGYFSANGAMDTCIVLRTAVVKDGTMYVQAGAGIVVDSVPESEHQECQHKARALMRAAEEAVKFAQGGAQGR